MTWQFRFKLDNSTNKLKEKLLLMFDKTYNQHQTVLDIFSKTTDITVDFVIANDENINVLLIEILEKSNWLIARERPFAIDLRRISSYKSVAREIERIADYAKNFAKFQKANNPSPEILAPIINMLKNILDMFKYVKQIIIDENDLLIKNISDYHKKIREIYNTEVNKIIKNINKTKNCKEKETIFFAFQQLKYAERIADHLTNICEAVIYIITGHAIELSDWILNEDE